MNYLDESLISENGCVSVEDYLADATEFIHDRQFDNQVTFIIHSTKILLLPSKCEIMFELFSIAPHLVIAFNLFVSFFV